MQQDKDISQDLQAQVQRAIDTATPLNIVGGNSKHWYGGVATGETLNIAAHCGIINYEPTELVITARAGTPLKLIEETLAAANQHLPFEPPHFNDHATLGGVAACNLSGPSRPYLGSARDLILGCRIINGKGEILHFGGEVMKNVAGYDVSRLMTGAMGTLGALLDISMKVLPKAESEITLALETDAETALTSMSDYQRAAYPLTAACHYADKLYLRLAGSEAAVKHAQNRISGEVLENGSQFWQKLREQELDFFNHSPRLWRLSIPADTPVMPVDGQWLYDWGGAQRWLITEASIDDVRTAASNAGGHASLFRCEDEHLRRNGVFQPLPTGMMRYHKQLKQAFDPKGLFNTHRLYPEF